MFGGRVFADSEEEYTTLVVEAYAEAVEGERREEERGEHTSAGDEGEGRRRKKEVRLDDDESVR